MVSVVSDSFEESQELCLDTGLKAPPRRSHVRGHFTGISEGTKRPIFTTSGSRSSGKIDLVGAEAQAMHQTMTKASSDEGSGRVEHGVQTREYEKRGKEELEEEPALDITLRSHGHIRVETLSWIEIIRRRHGFGNDSTHGLPPSGVGRTASAKDRIGLWMGSSDLKPVNETK